MNVAPKGRVGARQYAIEPRSNSCGHVRVKSPSARSAPCASREHVETFEHESARRGAGRLQHGLLESHEIREPSAGSRVEHLDPRAEPGAYLSRRARRRHVVTWLVAVAPFAKECVLEAADEGDIVVTPYDVVAGHQASEKVVKISDTGAHGRLGIRVHRSNANGAARSHHMNG